jgi:general secretion pathway protein I
LKTGASGGFTLVEVMVALAVVAVALPALLMSLYQQVDGTAYLRDKSLAHLVAANKLAETRILSRARQSLLQGEDSGVAEMGDREWYWWMESKPTEMDQFYRLEISVSAEPDGKDRPLHTLVAFMSADLRTATESANGGN